MHDQNSRIWIFQQDGARRAADAYRSMAAQPNWLLRLTLLTFFIVVAVPVFLLLMVAAVAALLVFFIGTAINRLGQLFRGGLPARGDGRENVRVIDRSDDLR